MTPVAHLQSIVRRLFAFRQTKRALRLAVTALLFVPAARADQPIVLQLKWYHQFQFAGFYAAEAKGFYAAEGLTVEIREGSPKRPAIQEVLSGRADFGVADEAVLLARLQGQPIVACAVIFQHSPFIVMARADSGIRKPSDLSGRSVMVGPLEGTAQFQAMLKHEGIPLGAVKQQPHTWRLRDLIEKRVDAITAYSTVEPTQLRQAGVEPAVVRVADYGVDFYGDTLFTSESVVKRNRAQVAAFIRATRRGWEYAMEHQEEMIDLILKKPEVQQRKLKRENLEIEAREMRPLILPDLVDVGHMNLGRWERMEQIFLETGLIRRKASLKGFLFEENPESDREVLWIFAGVLAVTLSIVGVALLWNFQLRRKVERSTRHVRLSEANLTALIENTTASIWSVDRDLRYITFNSHFRRQVEERIGRPPEVGMALEQILPGEELAERKQLYQRALVGEHFTWEVVRTFKHGPRILAESFNPISNGHEITGVTVFSYDITEQRQLEEQFRQSQKMEAIGQLAGGVAHDFNNLLMVIQGNASLALITELPPTEVKAVFQDIVAATERAAALTGQLLAFSRRQPMQPRDLEMNAIVDEASRMFSRLIGEDITLETQLAVEATPVHADAGMIEQVLLNLAVNARDAMPHGGRLTLRTRAVTPQELPVNLKARVDGEAFIRVDVSDTGRGIPTDCLPHIFEPFFTTKEVGKGTGLGLATAFGIAQQHGGWLTVESESGRGSTFSLFLPRRALAARVELAAARPTVANQRGSETVLIVEDDATVRSVVVHVLKQNGYRIYEAVNGQTALELWEQCGHETDMLITDMVMPGGVTGHELAQQLLAKKPALKVIYTSGYSAEVFRGDFVLPQGVDFLRKPYRAEDLLSAIRTALDGGGSRN
ncbi:MAG: ABC transporter substrate-binding protein [Chthoniobacter sp.]|uniref:ABC transporter substrate-binding protein n=1 Tax=Chthoniobacter sp. TaxID=2510640 RepID=UPI0032A3E4AF